MIVGALGAIGSVVGGLFGLKQGQQQLIEKAFDIVSDVTKSDESRAVAAAQIMSAEVNSGSWLVRNWRAIVALGFFAILVGYFFGWWNPEENIDPEIVERVFDIVEYSVLGFGGVHSLDNWIKHITTNKTLVKLLDNVVRKK